MVFTHDLVLTQSIGLRSKAAWGQVHSISSGQHSYGHAVQIDPACTVKYKQVSLVFMCPKSPSSFWDIQKRCPKRFWYIPERFSIQYAKDLAVYLLQILVCPKCSTDTMNSNYQFPRPRQNQVCGMEVNDERIWQVYTHYSWVGACSVHRPSMACPGAREQGSFLRDPCQYSVVYCLHYSVVS